MRGWLTVSQSLKQQQEAELQAQGSSQQLQRVKEELQDKVTSLQSSLQKLQSERAEMERVLTRLGKDKSALRKTLEKVSWPALYFLENKFILFLSNSNESLCGKYEAAASNWLA